MGGRPSVRSSVYFLQIGAKSTVWGQVAAGSWCESRLFANWWPTGSVGADGALGVGLRYDPELEQIATTALAQITC